jgi:glycosyltransferase involved in cell wall biosynthesis
MVNISLIVCTRNRSHSLSKTLQSVSDAASAVAPGSIELVLVDNGSSDDTLGFIQAYAKSSTFRVVVVSEPRAGLARARNAGVAQAARSIIAFTDDDCCIRQDYFAEILRLFDADAHPSLRGGQVFLGDASDLPFTVRTDTLPRSMSNGMHPCQLITGCKHGDVTSHID